jgi:hypothetical protein
MIVQSIDMQTQATVISTYLYNSQLAPGKGLDKVNN